MVLFVLFEERLEGTCSNLWLIARVLILGGWYGTVGRWKFILNET